LPETELVQKEPSPAKPVDGNKQTRGRKAGAIYFPRHSLKKALVIAETVWKDNGGEPYNRLSLAKSVDMSPTGSPFQIILASSFRYGLTEGSYVSEKITLTPLGRAIVAPKADEDTKSHLREALLKPELFEKVYSRFDQKPIPKEEIFKNTLLIDFKIPQGDVDACYKVIMENVNDYSLSQDIKATTYLQLDLLAPVQVTEMEESQGEEVIESPAPAEAEPTTPTPRAMPKQIFVAHGKNKKPLEQCVKILEKYKIPHIVATDEPHKGRPVGVKVAEEMKKCTAGIFIFTADEQSIDENGKPIMRPSDNVVYELGAGSVLYGNKIVIFREDGVDFASDFTEFGRITFEKDRLDAKGLELMTELAGLEIIKFTVT